MLKLIGYWTAPANPDDVAAFEDVYMNRHVPKAARLPGLKRLVTTRVEEGFEGTPVQHYRIAELLFEDKAALEEASRSPEWRAMRDDAAQLIRQFGVSNTAELGEEVETPPVGG